MSAGIKGSFILFKRIVQKEIMEITIKDEFIKLGQAMKLAGLVDNGSLAKEEIQAGAVKVNGETELRRGRKLVAGDRIEYNGEQVEIKCL